MGRQYRQPLQEGAGLTLDAGALIAFDRGDRRIRVLIQDLADLSVPILVPSCALAQVWRNEARQARLARLLNADEVEVEPLTDERARAVGELCALRATSDITDAFVVLVARQHGGIVVTSDPDDLRRLDPSLDIRAI